MYYIHMHIYNCIGTGQNGGTESEIYVTLYESLGVTYFGTCALH